MVLLLVFSSRGFSCHQGVARAPCRWADLEDMEVGTARLRRGIVVAGHRAIATGWVEYEFHRAGALCCKCHCSFPSWGIRDDHADSISLTSVSGTLRTNFRGEAARTGQCEIAQAADKKPNKIGAKAALVGELLDIAARGTLAVTHDSHSRAKKVVARSGAIWRSLSRDQRDVFAQKSLVLKAEKQALLDAALADAAGEVREGKEAVASISRHFDGPCNVVFLSFDELAVAAVRWVVGEPGLQSHSVVAVAVGARRGLGPIAFDPAGGFAAGP